ncbi:HNH endonuclease signature motif containing protein [Helcococcus ovis]|uniref:HNH endonuclease n=1 Tax=Helcococcus TaxID=31983 RepID=UPI0038B871D8
MPIKRPERTGSHRAVYESNKKKILKTQDICGICGKPVDKSLKYPDPMCAVIDHILPIAKGGHPSDIKNLQIAHHYCNRQKSDKLFASDNLKNNKKNVEILGNRHLPHSVDWLSYKALN